MMKTVTRVAGFHIQAKRFPMAVCTAQMCMTWASILIRPNEYGVVMRRVLIDQVPVCKAGNKARIQSARFEKIGKYAVHIRVRRGRGKNFLFRCPLHFRCRIRRFHILSQQHGHRFDITLTIEFLYKADCAATLIRRVVKPLTTANCNAVIAGQPLLAT